MVPSVFLYWRNLINSSWLIQLSISLDIFESINWKVRLFVKGDIPFGIKKILGRRRILLWQFPFFRTSRGIYPRNHTQYLRHYNDVFHNELILRNIWEHGSLDLPIMTGLIYWYWFYLTSVRRLIIEVSVLIRPVLNSLIKVLILSSSHSLIILINIVWLKNFDCII